MEVKTIQIVAGAETTSLVKKIQLDLRRKLELTGIVTNGFVLNSAVRELDKLHVDFENAAYWANISEMRFSEIKAMANETMKFRISIRTEQAMQILSETLEEYYGSRMRKSFIVKLLLKAYLYEQKR